MPRRSAKCAHSQEPAAVLEMRVAERLGDAQRSRLSALDGRAVD